MDVKSAFLNGLLDEEIYLRPPPGFRSTDKVWRLLRALYGLKQAPKAWYTRLRSVFESLGFTRSHADHSLFFMKVEDGVLIIVAIYVDDKLIISRCREAIERLKLRLSKEYELKDLGEARWILGIEIIRDRDKGTIQLSQRRYIEGLLSRFEMSEGQSVATPVEPNLKLEKLPEPEVDEVSYQSAIGGLMYAMLATRPDLAFA